MPLQSATSPQRLPPRHTAENVLGANKPAQLYRCTKPVAHCTTITVVRPVPYISHRCTVQRHGRTITMVPRLMAGTCTAGRHHPTPRQANRAGSAQPVASYTTTKGLCAAGTPLVGQPSHHQHQGHQGSSARMVGDRQLPDKVSPSLPPPMGMPRMPPTATMAMATVAIPSNRYHPVRGLSGEVC